MKEIIQKNGKYWKECDIVMLPTNNNSSIFKLINDDLKEELGFQKDPIKKHKSWAGEIFPQHLYILSNEQINEGDWYFNWETNYATEPKERLVLYNCTSKPNGSQPKKIIASTDSGLHYTKCNHCGHLNQMHDWSCNNCHKQGSLYFSAPKLPEDFIRKYVESNGSIKKILVEYVEIGEEEWDKGRPYTSYSYNLKLNPDNTINILIEDSVEEAAKKYAGIPLNADMEDEKYYNSTGFSNFNAFIEGAKWQKNQLTN